MVTKILTLRTNLGLIFLHPVWLILAFFTEDNIPEMLKGRNVAVAINKTNLGSRVIPDVVHIGPRVKKRVVKVHPVPPEYF